MMCIPIIHRVNSVQQLEQIERDHGVEVDLRWSDRKKTVVLGHGHITGREECLEDYLKSYNHKIIILNMKETGIEIYVIKLLEKYNIKSYFFLDLQFPQINNLLLSGFNNVAVRYSDLEVIPKLERFDKKPKWIWLDCFYNYPYLDEITQSWAEECQVCLVDPALQGHLNIKEILSSLPASFIPDAICLKESSKKIINDFFGFEI